MAKKTVAAKAARKPAMNRVSRGVIAGLKQAVAHTRGEISLPARYYDVPGPVNVKAIRAKSGLSQSEFAGRYGFNMRTLQEWELGRTEPPGAVRAYLTVIDRFPETVDKALKGKPRENSVRRDILEVEAARHVHSDRIPRPGDSPGGV